MTSDKHKPTDMAKLAEQSVEILKKLRKLEQQSLDMLRENRKDDLFDDFIHFVVPDVRTMDIDAVLEQCKPHAWAVWFLRRNGERVRIGYFSGDYAHEHSTPDKKSRLGWPSLALLKKFAKALPSADKIELEVGFAGSDDYTVSVTHILRKRLIETQGPLAFEMQPFNYHDGTEGTENDG